MLSFILMAGTTLAQDLIKEDYQFRAPSPKINPKLSADGDTTSFVMNYGRLMGTYANTNYYRTYLYPDSTVLQMYNNGPGRVSRHSLGQVVEPGENIWREYDGSPLYPWMDFTVDSIYLPYRYVRYDDSIPDTLIIQFYTDDKITTGTVPTWASGASYATVEYDYRERKGGNATKEIIYVLGQEDTATVATGTPAGLLGIPVDVRFMQGEFAATVTYIPGKPGMEGDTIEVYDESLNDNVNKVNAFIVYQYQEQNWDFVIKENFNNGLQANTGQRYNLDGSNWLGRYSPGTAYASNSGTYHTDMFFVVSYVESSLSENAFSDVKMYPNPTQSTLNLNFGSEEHLVVTVMNLEGKELITKVQNGPLMNFDLSTYPAGMYLVKMANDKFSVTQKLVKD